MVSMRNFQKHSFWFRPCIGGRRARAGYSLVEMMAVVLVIGLCTLVVGLQFFGGSVDAARRQSAEARAQALNVAKASFAARVAFAEDLWEGKSNGERYALLVSEANGGPFLGMAPDTLGEFEPEGYSFDLGDRLNSRVLPVSVGGGGGR
jgi:prepilin-type N-terminal cleavage/methylation domain-containing protein